MMALETVVWMKNWCKAPTKMDLGALLEIYGSGYWKGNDPIGIYRLVSSVN